MKPRTGIVVAGRVLLGAGLVGLWTLAHRLLGDQFVAGLDDIAARLWEIGASGVLVRDIGVTLLEAGIGMVVGGAAGFALPFLIARVPGLEVALRPFIAAAMGVPKLALAPLLILWFGIGLLSKVVFVALVVFFLLFFSTLAGIRSADGRLLAVARVLGLHELMLLREVMLPTTLPFVFASLKVALPRAISAAVVAEFVAADTGLGSYIQNAMSQADTVGVFTGVIVVTVVVVVVNAVLDRTQKRAMSWRHSAIGGF
ncbi:ABC transporter permease [Reyranella sp. CPCC 100927]|uniref:ABC transporter permease n=1 Tax=Reyranella sp. CPCC 100927 TaxID=2599616 RepID=UPI0011B3B091|nr:ABC transporter permease subunit [Reyranella sp. CPCC 100927]TWT14097.1 ABC transporter permease subunit [Reyranella sp. CPCC 100927]